MRFLRNLRTSIGGGGDAKAPFANANVSFEKSPPEIVVADFVVT